MMAKIDPADQKSFWTLGVKEKFRTYLGDQAYQDIIRFAGDCDVPVAGETQIVRTQAGTYDEVVAFTQFGGVGDYFFCYMGAAVDPLNIYFENIFWHTWATVERVTVATSNPTVADINLGPIRFKLEGPQTDGDKIQFAWDGSPAVDCANMYFLGSEYVRREGNYPSVWFGDNSGTFGIANSSMEELHVCFKSGSRGAPDAWIRLKATSGNPYKIRIQSWNITANKDSPELESFDPDYGTTDALSTNTTISFNFNLEAIYPAKSGADLG